MTSFSSDVETHISNEMVRRLPLVFDPDTMEGFGPDEFNILADFLIVDGVVTSFRSLSDDAIERIYSAVQDAWSLMAMTPAGRA